MKLKTRTNQPVSYEQEETSNIEQLSDDVLNGLKAGDIIEKKTGNQKHTYIVTYKEEGKGICLTYVDGSGYMETISYDYTGGHWVFNSKDVTQAMGENGVKGLIQADKDVLSQIVYDEETNGIIFPKGILPLRFKGPDYDDIFFDYNNGQVLVNGPTTLANDFEIIEDKVVVYDDNGDFAEIYEIEYMCFDMVNVNDLPPLNTYYLYHPQSGTKLYKHYLRYNVTEASGSGSGLRALVAISTLSTPLTLENLTYALLSNLLATNIIYGTNGNIFKEYSVVPPSSVYLSYYEYSNGSFTSKTDNLMNSLYISDTVTEL